MRDRHLPVGRFDHRPRGLGYRDRPPV